MPAPKHSASAPSLTVEPAEGPSKTIDPHQDFKASPATEALRNAQQSLDRRPSSIFLDQQGTLVLQGIGVRENGSVNEALPPGSNFQSRIRTGEHYNSLGLTYEREVVPNIGVERAFLRFEAEVSQKTASTAGSIGVGVGVDAELARLGPLGIRLGGDVRVMMDRDDKDLQAAGHQPQSDLQAGLGLNAGATLDLPKGLGIEAKVGISGMGGANSGDNVSRVAVGLRFSPEGHSRKK
ncbi:MAG: hypothetical protein K1X83_05620 [Oligoflexia bacterium]|nr:hypothetical protein [Oligoflexia bacterium]